MSFQMTARFQPPEGVANMKLSKVIGITSLTNSCVAEAESSDLIAYAAGCIAVLYNPNTNRQVSYFKVTRTISSLALTHDGIYLAIGERGHQPCITIWDTRTSEKISTLTGHQHGVGIMKFSLDDEILVSVGFKTDKQLLVWNWKEGKQTCSMKLENKVNSINFHMGGQFFVTCGDNHLKWWYMIKETHPTDSDKQIVKGLNGRPASILDVHRNSNFVDILCAKVNMNQSIHTNVYTLSSTGVLCLLHESRLMDKWVQVDTPTAYALALTPTSHVLVGCTNGRILVFSGVSLEYLASLPTPSPLPSSSTQSQIKYPACYSICSLSSSSHVISVYADRSMFIWDLTDIHQPIKLRSFTNHSSCIWDLQFLPTHPTTSPASHPTMALPSGTFFTCGADNMIHIWNLDPKQQRSSPWKSTSSRDLLHSLAVDIVETDVLKRKSLDADSLEFDLSSSFPDFELPDRQQVCSLPFSLLVHCSIHFDQLTGSPDRSMPCLASEWRRVSMWKQNWNSSYFQS
jgi:mitogen-activated protein kinase binding protein 1